MPKDHLDNEISVKAGVTNSGVEAKIKSRALSSVDRLLGSFFDRKSAPMESEAAEIRAKSAARIRILHEAERVVIDAMNSHPELAAEVLRSTFPGAAQKIANKSAVVEAALEDLALGSNPPPNPSENGPIEDDREDLDPVFLSRFERYAEDAGTDQVRAKWGRVLASEIRSPGTFSLKDLRVIDEIDSDAARVFEELCAHRLCDVVPICLSGELDFAKKAALVSADLLIEPGLSGQIRVMNISADELGNKLWVATFESQLLVVEGVPTELPDNETSPLIRNTETEFGIPVYVLTGVGVSISRLIENDQRAVFNRLADAMAEHIKPGLVHEYARVGKNRMRKKRTILSRI